MTLKKYQKIKLILVVLISIIFSQSIIYKNYLIPIITLIISSLVLMILRRRVKDVIADERDYLNAGKAAGWAIQVYSWFAVITMFALYCMKDLNPTYEPVAMTLAFSTCFLMFIYSFIFNFQNKIKFTNSSGRFIILGIIIAVFVGIFALRFFSGEDNWVCQGGEWVKHGHPDFATPQTICQ